jgi:tetratricopeptide (TPR) repeat protein
MTDAIMNDVSIQNNQFENNEIDVMFNTEQNSSHHQNLLPHYSLEYAKFLLEPFQNNDQVLPQAQYDQILSLFENYIFQSEERSSAHFEIGKLLHKYDPGEARNHYEEGLVLNPNFASIHSSLASLLETDFEEELGLARIHYEHALFLDPTKSMVHYAYANHLKNYSDNFSLAREHFEECLKLFPPESAEIRDELVQFLKNFYPNCPSIILHQKMIIKNGGVGEIFFRAFQDISSREIVLLGKDANDICCAWIDFGPNFQAQWRFLLPKIQAFCTLFLPPSTNFPNSIQDLIFNFYFYFE